jgi:hypothetical protein
MTKNPLFALLGAVVVFSCAVPESSAQSLPQTQPNLLTIIRERVKVGREVDHSKHERGWPAAFAKANSTNYYLAMSSMTGSSEVWYVIPWDSHAAEADAMKRFDEDPVLSAEMARLSRADAEYLDGIQRIQARARPDLSAGDFPNLAKVRFFHNTVFCVRPGKQELFETAAKAYATAAKRAEPKTSYRVYEVIAGMPTPSFFIFSSTEDYAQFDERLAAGAATWIGATDEEKEIMRKFSVEGLLESEPNRYRLDPQQSYVAEEVKAEDPAFWNAE